MPKHKSKMEHLSYEQKPAELGLFSLSKRRLRKNLSVLKELIRKIEGFFSRACSDRAMGNGLKLKEGRFRFDIRKQFFMMRVGRHWNR